MTVPSPNAPTWPLVRAYLDGRISDEAYDVLASVLGEACASADTLAQPSTKGMS